MNLSGQEVEVKFFIKDLPGIETRLRNLGGVCIQERRFELNLRYDTQGGDLSRTHRLLRLRQSNDAILTYKGPGQENNGILSRQEIEIKVDPVSGAQQILETLGFIPIFVYEKYRTVFELEKNQVMLDQLPFGSFVEIEGEDGEIRSAAQRLGLNWGKALPTSYHALFKKVRSELGLSVTDLTFINFENIRVTPEKSWHSTCGLKREPFRLIL